MTRFIQTGIVLAPLTGFVTYMVRFDVIGFPTSLLDLLLIAAVLAGGVLVWKRRIPLRPVLQNHTTLVASTGLFVVAATQTVLVAADSATAAGQWKSLVVLPVAYGAALLVLMHQRVLQKRHVLQAVVAGGIAVGVYAGWAGLRDVLTYDGRLVAPYSSPNELAMVLAPLVAGVVAAWVFVRRPAWWIVAGGGVVLGVTIATRSLGALGALSAVGVALWVLAPQPSKALRHWVLVGIAASVIGAGVWGVTSGWLQAQIIGRSSISARLEIWRAAIIVIERHWHSGIGFGLFQDAYLGVQALFSPYQEWAVPHPHNNVFAAWLGAGLFGLIGIVSAVGSALERVVRRPSPLGLVAAVGLSVMILHGLVDTTIFRNDTAILMWTLVVVAGVVSHDD